MKTSMQPLYGAETRVDTSGTPEWERWQHVSKSSQLTYDLKGRMEIKKVSTLNVSDSAKKKEEKETSTQHFLTIPE